MTNEHGDGVFEDEVDLDSVGVAEEVAEEVVLPEGPSEELALMNELFDWAGRFSTAERASRLPKMGDIARTIQNSRVEIEEEVERVQVRRREETRREALRK